MRRFATLALVAVISMPPSPLGAQSAPASRTRLDTATERAIARLQQDDPSYPEVNALWNAANAIEENLGNDVNVAKIKPGYDLVIARAMATKVRGTDLPHPRAGSAFTALGAIAMRDGDYAAALSYAERALPILRPFRNVEFNAYIQGISLVAYMKNNKGQPVEAAETLVEGIDHAERYIATVAHGDPKPPVLMAKSNLEYTYATVLTKLGRLNEAVIAQRASLDSRVRGLGIDNPDAIASRYNYALTLVRAGRVDEGEAEARRAVDQSVAHVDPAHPTYARTFEALGLVLGRNGKRSEAAAYLRRSLDIKRTTVGTKNIAFHAGVFNLGDVFLGLERYAEAATALAESAAGYRLAEGAGSSDALRADGYLGIADYAEGKSDALRELEDSFGAVRARDAKERYASSAIIPTLIVARWTAGRTSDAHILATQHETDLGGADRSPPFALANAAALRAYTAERAAPGWELPARQAARQIVALIRSDRSLSDDGDLPQPQRLALDLALRVAADTADPALSLEAMAVLAGSRIAKANRLLAQRFTETDPTLAARVRTFQDLAQSYRNADGALLKALAGGSGITEARAARETASAAAQAARNAIARDFPRWIEARGGEAPDLATIQAGLRGDEALLAVVPAFDGVFVLTATKTAARIDRATLGRKQIYDLIARVRNSLSLGTLDAASSATLKSQFLPRSTTAMLARTRSLRIVAAGPVAALPFALLLDRPVTRIDRHAPYLIRRYALRLAAGFAPLAIEAKTRSEARFLGIGAPTAFGDPAAPVATTIPVSFAADRFFRGGTPDATALSRLPSLPTSEREVRDVARSFGRSATLLIGTDASEARIRSMDLTPYSTLLFATHGLIDGEMEGVVEPSLVLARPETSASTDGLLTASEIATLRLNADWIILSACNTAAGENGNAPAFSGLAQAFRYAGGRALLVSHWPVRDDIAARISVATLAGARHGLTRDVALQRAILRVIDDRSSSRFADPFLWAPYVLIE